MLSLPMYWQEHAVDEVVSYRLGNTSILKYDEEILSC